MRRVKILDKADEAIQTKKSDTLQRDMFIKVSLSFKAVSSGSKIRPCVFLYFHNCHNKILLIFKLG